MFPFNNTVLLLSVRVRNMMNNASLVEMLAQLNVFTSSIRLDCTDFGVKRSFSIGLKLKKGMLYIRLIFEKINLCITIVIIDETDIITKTTNKGSFCPHTSV